MKISGVTLYILKDRKPISVEHQEWMHWFEASSENKLHERWVASSLLDGGKVRVSTVFLSLNHNFLNKGPPILFETMIFGLEDDEYQTRCSTYEEALKMHEKAIEYAEAELKEQRS